MDTRVQMTINGLEPKKLQCQALPLGQASGGNRLAVAEGSFSINALPFIELPLIGHAARLKG